MTVHLFAYKLSYFAVPKVACTSIKTALFEVENGFAFRNFRTNGLDRYIHNAYPTRGIEAYMTLPIGNHVKLALVRDPIDRIISCYNNRVKEFGELSTKNLGTVALNAGVPADPGPEVFIKYLDEYCKYSESIRHHTDSMTLFLGKDKSFFTEIFSFSDIEKFAETCTKIVGHTVTLPKLQVGRPGICKNDLTPESLRSLRARYQEDYDLFGDLL